ncbi:glycoside hydrolase family 30 protein [Puniceicoccales bacterium CK1056]|uniref:Glycoside hydrolase family 30 protein n=1 Tax=Oceanipulchritudo coccoides TaxID=2706888 RepID=A0A6B2M4G0_9BACT|nr:glycoside hydrolase family 30 protein [Oceanipulchritudo coccoides]NDV63236.1 glycoside hydrolase family 30 protein [Oceanipulchritudo coccoides]
MKLIPFFLLSILISTGLTAQIHQTTRQGDRLAKVRELSEIPETEEVRVLSVDPSREFQTLLGIGGSFTESAAEVFYELSKERQAELLKACFSPEGAHYSLTRTHIASCDFSLRNFTYAPVTGDLELEHFSIEPDRTWLLPLIKSAQAVAGADFRILASPWTAPPWMKDNKTWNGGKLLPEYYGVFSDYLVKYIRAYAAEGIPIWGITPMNEPLGNGANWESTHFTPDEMRVLIKDHLGPTLKKAELDILIWIFDQNRDDELIDWTNTILGDEEAAAFVAGTAVHWYESTVSSSGEVLDQVQQAFPDKQILHSEGCIDAMGDDETIGAWLEDDWYWRAEATDWGYIWASDEDKPDHPPYRPFYRYARDLIEGLNHHLTGWIDWNLLLNFRGGPNHARNYCLAPILVDSGRDRIYYTPLYYAMAHVSKFVRPGAVRVGLSGQDDAFLATAFRNPDQSIAVVVFNPLEEDALYSINLPGRPEPMTIRIPGQALQTVVLPAGS